MADMDQRPVLRALEVRDWENCCS